MKQFIYCCRGILVVAGSVAVVNVAGAQSVDTSGLPPIASTVVDKVDVFRGQVDDEIFSIKLGDSDAPMSIPISLRIGGTGGFSPNWNYSFEESVICMQPSSTITRVAINGGRVSSLYNGVQGSPGSQVVGKCPNIGSSFFADGSTLTAGSPYSSAGFTYMDRNGGVSYYDVDSGPYMGATNTYIYPIKKRIFPNGVVWTYTQNKGYVTSVTSSTGYKIDINPAYPPFGNRVSYNVPRDIVLASTACLSGCAETQVGSIQVDAASSGTDVTINGIYLGRIYLEGATGSSGYHLQGVSKASDVNVLRYQSECLASANRYCPSDSFVTDIADGNGHKTSLAWDDNAVTYTGAVIDRNGQSWKYTANWIVIPGAYAPFLSSVKDPLGRTTAYNWNMTYGKLSSVVLPSGKTISAAYDSRGNEITTTTTSAGNTLPPLVVRRVFPTSCTSANQRICNKPTAVIDARGNETDYVWDPTHGGMLSETRPPDASGNRPVITYGYTAFTGIDGATFYLMTSKVEAIDPTHSRTTTYEYDPNDHWEMKSEIDSSDGVNLRTCFKHDAMGNIISKTTANAALNTCP